MGKTAILAVKIVGDALGGKAALTDTGDAAGGLFGKLQGGVGVALGVGAAIGTAAVVAGKALYDIGATWDDVADTIRVGTGATGDALEGMVDSAKNIATSIPAAIEDIGPVVADLNTRLGLTGDTLETVGAQYLEAGRMLGEQIDIGKTTAAFSAFKIEGDAVEGAMDNLFRVSQATGVGMNDLAASASSVAPAMQTLGFGFEDTISLVGSLDKAGLDSNATLKAMQKGMVTLAKAGEEPSEAFRRVTGEIQGFIDKGDSASAIDLAAKVFGTKGAAQLVGAIQSGTMAMDDLFAATGATGDTILELGKETGDAAEKWQVLKNKALVALEPLGSAVFDGVGRALDWLSGIIDTTDFTPLQAGLDQVVAAFDGLGPLLAAAGELFQALAPIVETTFGAILGIIEPGLNLIQAVIATVVAVIQGDWSGAWDGIMGIVSSAKDLIIAVVRGLGDIVMSIIRTLGLDKLFGQAWDAAVRAVNTGIENVKRYFSELPSKIKSALGDPGAILTAAGKAIIDGFFGGLKRAWDTGKGWITGIGDWIADHKGPISKDRVLLKPAGQAIMGGFVASLRDQLPTLERWADEATTIVAGITANPTIDLDRTGRGRQQAGGVNIYINGALDPAAVARQIRDLLNRDARIRGTVGLSGAVIV